MAVYQSLTLTQLAQDSAENTSRIRVQWQSVQTGSSYNQVSHTAKLWLTVNGVEVLADAIAYTLPYGSTAVICDREFTVNHDENGQAAVTARTWMDTRISAGVVELSKSLQLTQIPRPTAVTAPDTVMGSHCRIVLTPRYPGVQHSLFYQFAGLSGYLTGSGEAVEQETVFSGNGVDFLLPEDFMYQLPNQLSGVCTLTCRTYLDGQPVGEPQQTGFTAIVNEAECWPVLSAAVRDINPETVALTGSDRVLIAGASTAQCILTPETYFGATVVQRKIGDVVLEDSDGVVMENIRQIPVFSLTDSRGLVDTYTPRVTLIPYYSPTCQATLTRLHPTDGRAQLAVTGQWFSGDFGAAVNSLQLQYQVDGGTWQTMAVTVQDTGFTATAELTDMAYDRLYTLTLTVTDRLSRVEKRLVLKKSIPVFDWGENDFHFHVPVTVDSTLTVAGKPLLDYIYPLGGVYISTLSQSPADLFGGQWEACNSTEPGIYMWKRVK